MTHESLMRAPRRHDAARGAKKTPRWRRGKNALTPCGMAFCDDAARPPRQKRASATTRARRRPGATQRPAPKSARAVGLSTVTSIDDRGMRDDQAVVARVILRTILPLQHEVGSR